MELKEVSVSKRHERRVSRLAEDFVIEMLHITKEFPGIKANDDITTASTTDRAATPEMCRPARRTSRASWMC